MSLDTPTPLKPQPVIVYGSSGNVLSGVVAGDVAAGGSWTYSAGIVSLV